MPCQQRRLDRPVTLAERAWQRRRDFALAVALKESEPGDWVLLHDPRCPLSADDADENTECGCHPLCLQVGATA